MKDLSGKVAVVTGAASGIGFALARGCLDQGMKVVLADVEETALHRAADDLSRHGEVLPIPTDVSLAESVEALRRRAESFGQVALVCNNAGVGGASGNPGWALSLQEWRWVLEVNLWGVVHGLRAFVPGMIERDDGHVVNTASIGGLLPFPFAAPYAASKHAVVGISLSVQQELASIGSHVGISVLCPGFVKTSVVDGTRNWPGRLGPVPPPAATAGAAQIEAFLRAMVENGMDPAEVAGQVIDAVRAGRFWVLPNAEPFAEQIRDVAAGAVELRDPPVMLVPATT